MNRGLGVTLVFLAVIGALLLGVPLGIIGLIGIIFLAIALVVFLRRFGPRETPSEFPATPTRASPESPVARLPFVLSAWALRGLEIGVLVGVMSAMWAKNQADPYWVRALMLVPACAGVGSVVGALAYALVRGVKGTAKAARTVAPAAADVAVAAARASINAVNYAKQSPLERRLTELDRLFTEGKITAEERSAGRRAALSKG